MAPETLPGANRTAHKKLSRHWAVQIQKQSKNSASLNAIRPRIPQKSSCNTKKSRPNRKEKADAQKRLPSLFTSILSSPKLRPSDNLINPAIQPQRSPSHRL